jgi:hypothetical protein
LNSVAPTFGDLVPVERLAANLVDNAVRYNLAGGSVRVKNVPGASSLLSGSIRSNNRRNRLPSEPRDLGELADRSPSPMRDADHVIPYSRLFGRPMRTHAYYC